MSLSNIERVTAIMLALTIVRQREFLELTNGMGKEVIRLNDYGLFTVSELSEIANISRYRVSTLLKDKQVVRARSGIKFNHLDHLVRMVGPNKFARRHIKSLVEEGSTFSAIARVTGVSESSLRRWAKES